LRRVQEGYMREQSRAEQSSAAASPPLSVLVGFPLAAWKKREREAGGGW
jgi:hypothetical protein